MYNKAALLAEKKAVEGDITTEEENMAVRCFKDAVLLYQQYGPSGDGNYRCIIRTFNREIMFYLKATRSAFPDLKYVYTTSLTYCFIIFIYWKIITRYYINSIQ